jgi:YHS domain-containing protein
MKRTFFLAVVSSLIALFLSATALSQESAAPRVVLKGHDPVAYFTESKPVKGDPKYRYDWDEGRYYFANERHRDMFAGDPERYAPRFGGYCTGSMARNVSNEGDPEAWVIQDGRLYVFGEPKWKALAEKDPGYIPSKIPSASKNWQEKKNRAS